MCLVGGCTRTLHMCCHLCLFISTRRSHLCHREFFWRSRTPARFGGAGRPPAAAESDDPRHRRRLAEPDARPLLRSRTTARRGRPARFLRNGFRTGFCLHKRQYQWCMCFWGFSRCVGKAEQCEQFSVRSSSVECHWAGNSAQFAWSGSARRGCLRSEETMDTHLSWQMCRAFS